MISPFRVFVVVLMMLIAGLQMRLWVGQNSFAHVSTLETDVEQRTAENTRKTQRNAVLKAEIKDLKQGLDAVEDMARSELGFIKKGETFYLLVED